MIASPSSPTFCATITPTAAPSTATTTTATTTAAHGLNSYRGPPSRANTSSPRPKQKLSLPNSPQPRPSSPLSNPQVKIAPPSPPAKLHTADTGTQYTPPDWPPTSSRSSLNSIPLTQLNPSSVQAAVPHPDSPAQNKQATVQDSTLAAPAPSSPPEAPLRVTPQTSLRNAASSARRSRSREVDTPADPPANKKAKGHNSKLVTLPSNYAECDNKVLASIIADMLMELIRHNDVLPMNNGQLTRFHSRAPPGISVHDYLARLTFHATLSPPILLSMVHYIDKLCSLYQAFTINSLTVHRFLIVAATVASKGLSDSFWTNSTYARVGGVSVKELALLELELLERVHWRIVPSPEALVDYYKSLVERSAQYVIEGEPVQDDEVPELDHDEIRQGRSPVEESGSSDSDQIETSTSGFSDGEG